MPLLVYADIEAEYERNPKLNRENIAHLEEWQRKQGHLPSPLHPIEIALFLHNCSYSSELAKQRIDLYFTFRTLCPEFFGDQDPLGAEVQLALDSSIVTVLPDLTPDGCLVIYIRMGAGTAKLFNYNAGTKICAMIVDLAIKERGCHDGHICIIDLEGSTMAHLIKCHLLSVKKSLVYLQAIIPLHVKVVHFVNGVSFMKMVLAIFKPFFRKELQDMMFVHFGDNSTMLEHFPEEMVPIECGGSKFSVIDYYNNVTRKSIEEHAEYFKLEQMRLVDESKRPGKVIHKNMFDVDGTFRQIKID